MAKLCEFNMADAAAETVAEPSALHLQLHGGNTLLEESVVESVVESNLNHAQGGHSGGTEGLSDDGDQPATAAASQLSLDEALEKLGFGMMQWRVLIVCGLCFASDSIEVGLLSFLQSEVKFEFDLNSAEEATISSVVFAGELLGGLVWGPLADRFGRRRVSLVSACLIAGAGAASAFSPNFATIVSLRALVGFGVGGLAVVFDILAEFVPVHARGRTLMGIEFFWTFGTIFVNGLAWITLDTIGWRYFVGLCSVPVVVALAGFVFLPESPHWLLSTGRKAEAEALLKRAARINGKPHVFGGDLELAPLSGDHDSDTALSSTSSDGYGTGDDGLGDNVAEDDDKQSLVPGGSPGGSRAHQTMLEKLHETVVAPLKELYSPRFRRTTATLWGAWISFGFSYYGAILIMPEAIGDVDSTCAEGVDRCRPKFNYPALFVASSAEVFGCLIGFYLINKVGRCTLSSTSYAVCGVATLLLGIQSSPSAVKVILAVISRGSIFIGSCATWVATPELYPTHIRAAGHGWANSVARIGGFASPFWGNANIGLALRLGLFGLIDLTAALCSWLLPETKDVRLKA
eukprot:m.418075 g.418075  ORF g.418075 m.418075 type:complete len:575 (-) comp20184_c0_seq26:48-1772(-)